MKLTCCTLAGFRSLTHSPSLHRLNPRPTFRLDCYLTLTSHQVWRVELAASTSGLPYGPFTVNNAASNTSSSLPRDALYSSGNSGKAGISVGFPPPLAIGNNASLRKKYSGGGGTAPSGSPFVDPTLAAISSLANGGGQNGSGGTARARVGSSSSALRVCGSSMVRCVSPEEGAVVSVHHFNTELGSPLVYGTRKGGVRSWDLRAREVSGWDRAGLV